MPSFVHIYSWLNISNRQNFENSLTFGLELVRVSDSDCTVKTFINDLILDFVTYDREFLKTVSRYKKILLKLEFLLNRKNS